MNITRKARQEILLKVHEVYGEREIESHTFGPFIDLLGATFEFYCNVDNELRKKHLKILASLIDANLNDALYKLDMLNKLFKWVDERYPIT